MRRVAALVLILVVGAVATLPAPLEGLSGAPELRKRRGDEARGHDADHAIAARKTPTESVSAALKRPSSPSLRRVLPAIALSALPLALQAPERGGDPTTPAYLRVYGPANPNALRAPPV